MIRERCHIDVGEMWFCFFFFFFLLNRNFNTSNFSWAYCMWRTKFSLTKQKQRKQSFCCQRGTLSQCMTYQTRKWQVKHNEGQNSYYKDFLSWVAIRNVQQNWENHTKGTYQLRVYLFLWKQSIGDELVHAVCVLTHHGPCLCLLLLDHCDTRLHLQLLQNNEENYYYTLSLSLQHTKCEIGNLLHSKSLTDWFKKTESRIRTACDVETISSYFCF